MNVNAEALKFIETWVDTQLTFPNTLSDNVTTKFFQTWQQKYLPEHKYVHWHVTADHGNVFYSWSVYFCTCEERYKQLLETQLSPGGFETLWADYLIYTREHIHKMNITADSVNQIVVKFEY